MKQVTATVEHGQIKLPESVVLPEGAIVRIAWDDAKIPMPLEDEEWTEEEMRMEIAQALQRAHK